jgi:hypothetical protein
MAADELEAALDLAQAKRRERPQVIGRPAAKLFAMLPKAAEL